MPPADPAPEPPTGPIFQAGSEPSPTSWVGRATARTPPPPPPEDPWWPTPEQYPRGYTAPYPMVPPRPRRSGMRVALAVAGIFAACCAGGATVALLTTASNGGSGTIGQAPPAPPGLNSVVKDGRFEFVVTSVECGHDTLGTLVRATAKGQYCVVDLSVTNTGTEAQTFTEGLQRALGPQGEAYSSDAGAGVIVNVGFTSLWSTVDPGATLTGKIVYDIPDEASIVKLELHDAIFSRGAVVTL